MEGGNSTGVDLASLIAGDAAEWSRFVDLYLPVVYSAVRNTLQGAWRERIAAEVGDLAQDVFLQLCRNDFRLLRTFDPGRASLRTWIALVSRTCALSAVRRRRVATLPLLDGLDLPAPAGEPTVSVRIPEGLLAPKERLVLHLLYDRELGTDEVATLLGITRQTVRSAHHKALVKLRRHFGEEAPEGAAREPGEEQ